MQGLILIIAGICLGAFLSIIESKYEVNLKTNTLQIRVFYSLVVLCILLISVGMYLEINAYMQTL